MIISHKHKFIFIKTGKVAGTSIEVFLSQHCGDSDIVTPIYPRYEQHVSRNQKGVFNPFSEIISNRGRGLRSTLMDLFKGNKFYNHMPAQLVKNRISSNIWNEYFKFTVERNPWDKTLSHFHMINDRAGGDMSFDEYLANGEFCFNFHAYTDSKGNLMVDKIVKYESLIDDLTHVFDKLGIPFEGSLGVRARSEHRKDRRPYTEVFKHEQKTIIEKAFVREIQMHDYTY